MTSSFDEMSGNVGHEGGPAHFRNQAADIRCRCGSGAAGAGAAAAGDDRAADDIGELVEVELGGVDLRCVRDVDLVVAGVEADLPERDLPVQVLLLTGLRARRL